MNPERGAVEVKICGLTSREDALHAFECGADYLGFVLYPASPRGISAARLREVVSSLPEAARLVGVFVNESPAEVARVAADCRLCAVQLHGDERAVEFGGMPVPVWRSLCVRQGLRCPDPGEWRAARYVFDTACGRGSYGGTGKTGDWGEAGRLAEALPVMLAGGLTPGNVRQAIRAVRPLGVDVSSGVERRPGRKDPVAVRAFIENAKGQA